MRASGREVIKLHFEKMKFLPPSQRIKLYKFFANVVGADDPVCPKKIYKCGATESSPPTKLIKKITIYKGGVTINFIKNKIKNNKLKGTFSEKDKISPSYINLNNPRYIEIDNIFYSGILIVNYYREYNDLILKKLIDSNLNMNISIFYEKQDPYKTIRNLTYHIANVGVDLKESNQNRQDIDIAAFTYNDAKYIRKEIQVNNEDIYFLYIYINLSSEDVEKQEYLLNKIEGILESTRSSNKKGKF